MQLEEPLTKITAGQWDAGERAKERLAHKTIERQSECRSRKIFTPFNAGDYKAAAAAIDEAIKENPDLEAEFNPTKFAALCNGGEIESELALGEKLLAANNDQAAALNAYFWDVIDPDLKRDPDPALPDWYVLPAAQWSSARRKSHLISIRWPKPCTAPAMPRPL